MGSFDPKKDAGRSTGYMIRRRHIRDEGSIVLPTSTGVMVCRLYSPVEYLVIDWACNKNNRWPTAPSFRITDSRVKFLRGERCVDAPDVDSSLSSEFRLCGTYVYVITSPIGLDSDLASGKMSWEPLDAAQFTVPSSAFSRDIIDVPIAASPTAGWVVSFTGIVSGGTFRLRVNGVDTSNLYWNTDAGSIDSALEAIVGSGGATVVGPAPFTVSFIAAAVLGVGDNSLTGTSPNVVVTPI